MPELGHRSIDETVQTTNEWLNDLAERTGGDKGSAWHVLRAGLHTIRDRMTPPEAVDLSQQLPLLVRGIWFENWRPSDTPRTERDRAAWLAVLEADLRELSGGDTPAVDPAAAATAIFAVLKAQIGDAQMSHLEAHLPGEVAEMLRTA